MSNNIEIGRVVQNSSTKLQNNIISGSKLRDIQRRVLRDLKDAVIHSMGPAGSNSLILRGSSDADIVAEYSKDGNKIIKHIKYQFPIEMAIKSEIENATRHIEKEVGDGTSSIVVMSSLIFDALCEYEKAGKFTNNPYETMRIFKEAVAQVSSEIRSRGRECTLEDIYDIAYNELYCHLLIYMQNLSNLHGTYLHHFFLCYKRFLQTSCKFQQEVSIHLLYLRKYLYSNHSSPNKQSHP